MYTLLDDVLALPDPACQLDPQGVHEAYMATTGVPEVMYLTRPP